MTAICLFCHRSFPLRASYFKPRKSLKCPHCGQELNNALTGAPEGRLGLQLTFDDHSPLEVTHGTP